VLSSLVYKDADKSAEYINQLSKVYRNILDKSEENIVPFENELKLLDSYIFLMKIRFGNTISFHVEISEDGRKNAYIAPNTLQLLVENAIKHNKCSLEEPLHITITDDIEFIYIKNNTNRRKLIDAGSGIGLENIRHRFELLGGKKIRVTENENDFTVALPKYNKYDYENINI
jgi:two-component system, LytTR family, sensor kinase